jgi:tetratricopeptide (TPR) repeat protein
LRDLFPDRPELSADLASSLELLGDIERSARRLSEARSHFEASRNERQRLLDKWPDHKDRDEWVLGLSQSEVRLGDVDLDESRLDGIRSTPRAQALVKDGDEHYRRSLAGGASLYRQNPESERWQRELSWGFYKRGDYNAAVSRHEDAITDYDNALCLRRRLVARAEYNTRYVSDVAWTLQKIGSSWMALERWSVAETALLESLALRQRLARHGAQDDKTLNRDYYFSIQRLGELKMRTNVPEVALALVLEGKRVQLELQGSDVQVPSMASIETWARAELVQAEARRIVQDLASVLNRRVLAEAGKLLTPRSNDEACITELRKTIVALTVSGGH